MILTGATIREYVEQDLIQIRPGFDPAQLRPFGLRVHLSERLLVAPAGQVVDLSQEMPVEPEWVQLDLNAEPFTLPPGGFALGCTSESFRLTDSLMCRLDGRSTLARLGLLVHCSAAVIDGNHLEPRSIVVELANVGPFKIVIPPYLAIGMVTFERVAGWASPETEHSQYVGQSGLVPARVSFKTPKYNPSQTGSRGHATSDARAMAGTVLSDDVLDGKAEGRSAAVDQSVVGRNLD